MVTRAIERAQKQVEAQNFAVRKHLLEYDDVMNKQRESIYTLRRELLEGKIQLDEDERPSTRAATCWRSPRTCSTTASIASPASRCDVEEWDLAGAAPARSSRVFGARARRRSTASTSTGCRADEIRDALWERIVKRATTRRNSSLGAGAPAPRRARHHAADRRRAVEGSPLHPRPPEGRHRPARLRPARSARRVQEESFALFQDMKARIEEEMVRDLWWLRPVLERRRRRRGRSGAGAAPRRRRSSTTIERSRRGAAVGGVRRPRIRGGRRRTGAAAATNPFAPSQPSRRASAATTPSRRSSATSRRSAATIRARAAAARNTRSATGPKPSRREADMDLEDRPLGHRPRHRHRHRAHLRRRPARAAALARSCRRRSTSPRASPATSRSTCRSSAPRWTRSPSRAGDRDGAARRHRRHPQEPVDRGAGDRGRSRQAVGERHDRQPDHALAREPDPRGARADEEVPDLRRADHRGRKQGRPAASAS